MNMKGMKTRLASSKLADFSLPEEIYDFSMPSPVGDLFDLKEPFKPDLELARELFVPDSEAFSSVPDFDLAARIFLPGAGK